MTTRYTDQEWASIITDIERQVHRIEVQSYGGGSHSGSHDKHAAAAGATAARPIPAVDGAAFAGTIDHTLLKLDATSKQVDGLCAEARVAGFATVCVRPKHVSQVAADLKGSTVRVSSVIGFPEGTHDLLYKMQETRYTLEAGAQELDVVVNWPQLRAGQYNKIYNELAALRAGVSCASPSPKSTPPLTLILETSQLSRQQIIAGCVIAGYASFSYVKTSTGFAGHGATVENVRLMKTVCKVLERKSGLRVRVKASGGIKTLRDAVNMLEAGATRLGTSGGVWIVKEGKESVSSGRRRSEQGANRPGLSTRLFTDY